MLLIKQALMIIDGSPAGEGVINFGLHLAKKDKIHLTGVGFVDTSWLAAAQPEPLGAGGYFQGDDQLLKAANRRVRDDLENFHTRSRKAKIQCFTRHLEGDPLQEIGDLSQEYDLLIAPTKIDLHPGLEKPNMQFLMNIGRAIARPMYVVPQTLTKSTKVLLAFDGSQVAAKAIHLYFLMNLAYSKDVHVISIHKNADIAHENCLRIIRLANAHNIAPKAHAVASTQNPGIKILELMDTLRPAEIVAGAFGASPLHDKLFGSCTRMLLEKSTIPLFIHH